MSELTTSVLIASRRPGALARCLQSQSAQTRLPDQVVVVWQGDDTATRDTAQALAATLGLAITVVHSPEVGVVAAENIGLAHARGDVILLIDDDAVAPPDWLARHLAHYVDPRIGAVGGPFDNYGPDGKPFVTRSAEPVGKITCYGKVYGNIHDHPPAWRSRKPIRVDHLAGGNMSLRRVGFEQFDTRLKPYWQSFEMDACLQVRARGYDVLFDFANVINHYPTNTAFTPGREGDLAVKIWNPAYNQAAVLGKHLTGWRRAACLAFMLGVGTRGCPGLLGALAAVGRYGRPLRELHILGQTLRARLAGWFEGSRDRRQWIDIGKASMVEPNLQR